MREACSLIWSALVLLLRSRASVAAEILVCRLSGLAKSRSGLNDINDAIIHYEVDALAFAAARRG
jgi:hypothetical protein